MKTVEWRIYDLIRDTETGFVVKVVWKVFKNDGKYVGCTTGETKFDPTEERTGFIPYSDLTEIQVLIWISDRLSGAELDEINKSLSLQIAELKKPTVTAGVPW